MKLLDLVVISSFMGLVSYGGYQHEQTAKQQDDKLAAELKRATNLSEQLTTSLLRDKNARKLLSKVFQRDMTAYSLASTTVTITAYSAREAETDDSPHLTADMSYSRIGLLAVSRDMLAYLDYGQIVLLPNYGLFRVSDTMAKRFTHRVDILHSSPRSARLFGKHINQTLIWTF